jgi:hypothetical protein
MKTKIFDVYSGRISRVKDLSASSVAIEREHEDFDSHMNPPPVSALLRTSNAELKEKTNKRTL